MKKEFCVCYASSNEYSQYTGISLLSLLENNRGLIDRVYILSFGIIEENLSKIRGIAASFCTEIVVIDAISKMGSLFEKLEMQSFEGSFATYARAFIADIIDDYNGKLLYIDSDTIVDGSLYKLIEIDLENLGKAYAGVVGMNQYVYPYTETMLDSGNTKYYACGVILFEMKNWRISNCPEKIVNYVLNAKDKEFRYADQTVINNCIPEQLAYSLDLEYNYWGHIFRGKRLLYELTRKQFYTKEQVLKAKRMPIVIHYKGYIVHPWLRGNVSSLSERYQYYKSKSPWKNEREKSVYYSEKDNKVTLEQINRMIMTRLYLRYPAILERLIEALVEIKHRIIRE